MTFRAANPEQAKVGTRRVTTLQANKERPKETASPYSGHSRESWPGVTRELISAHPLSVDSVIDAVLGAWDGIFETSLGRHGLGIGEHIFPAPQIMGFLLHELVPYEVAAADPGVWQVGTTAEQKDLVCKSNDRYSVEIKTSSHPVQIFGNRSYGQQGGPGKKAKNGYYVAVNFEGWEVAVPSVRRVRWGWLDHTDWVGQEAASGQQSSLPAGIENAQLLTIYER